MQYYKSIIAKNICAFLLALLLFTFYPVQAENDLAENFPCADSSSVMDCVEKTQSFAPSKFEEMPLDSQQLGYQGPFTAGVRYDTQLKWIPELSYVQLFYDNGVNLLVDYGANEKRANVTLGHVWDGRQQVKVTYEYLSQRLPYDFDSGTVKEWVAQNAIGAAYQYLFFDRWIHSIDLNAYYIQANNKELSDVIFSRDNESLINFRRIAGGKEGTGTANISIHPFRQTLISLGGGYSQIDYDTQYEDHSNNSTFAYNAGIEYLFNSRIKISSNVAHDAAQTEEKVRLSTIFLPKVEAAVSGDFSQGLNGLPNSTSVLLSLAYPVAGYSLFSEDSLASLKTWIQQPVVHAPRVLAIKDEETKQMVITSTTSPSPQFLQTGDMIQEVHTSDYFKIDPALFDKVLYTLSFKDNSSDNFGSAATPQSVLNIDVKNDNNSVYQGIIYSTNAIPNAAAPENSRNTYEVVITANGYRNNQIITTNSVNLELNINFNPNNEPQWDKNKANQSIPFDVGAITDPKAILLNSLLVNTPSNITPKFTFAGGTTVFGNWQIVTSGDQSYLIRKPDSTGAYDAGDITIGNAVKNLDVYAKYSSDPDNYQGNLLTLLLKVDPDTSLQLVWDGNNAVCKVPALDAHQPLESGLVNSINLAKCIQYYKKSGDILNVNNDVLNFKSADKGGYSGNVNLSNNQLQLGYPDSGLEKSYNFKFTVNSTAQGSDSTVAVNNFVSVSKTMVITTVAEDGANKNFYTFISGTKYSSLVINKLDAGEYKVNAVTPPPTSIPNGYCQYGLATDQTSFEKTCGGTSYSNSFSTIANSNQADLLWFAGADYPGVSTVTIIKK